MPKPKLPDLDENIRIEVLPLESLRADTMFQRPLSERRVREIVAAFKPSELGVIVVSERKKGDYVILDGQHRWMALVELGYMETVCEVIAGLSISEEADIFYGRNIRRRALTPNIAFRARLLAMEPMALQIDAAVKAARMSIALDSASQSLGSGLRASQVVAITALERVYGWGVLPPTMLLLSAAWNRDDVGFFARRDVIMGTAGFLRHWPEASLDEAVKKFTKVQPEALLSKAHGMALNAHSATAWMGLSMLLRSVYNRDRKLNMLPPRDLTTDKTRGWTMLQNPKSAAQIRRALKAANAELARRREQKAS